MKAIKKIIEKHFCAEIAKCEIATIKITYSDFDLYGKRVGEIAKEFMKQYHPSVDKFSFTYDLNNGMYEITIYSVGSDLIFHEIEGCDVE